MDTIHAKITDKVSAMRNAIELARKAGVIGPLNILADELHVVETQYNFAVADVLARYYEAVQGTGTWGHGGTAVSPSGVGSTCINGAWGPGPAVALPDDSDDMKTLLAMLSEIPAYVGPHRSSGLPDQQKMPTSVADLTKRYEKIVLSENFGVRLNDIASRLKAVPGVYQIAKRQMDVVASIDVVVRIKKTDFDFCKKCRVKMEVLPQTSELRCPSVGCGKVKRLYGTVFADHQYFSQEGQKSKHGSYDPHRHFRFWMDRIQARESNDFPPEDLERIEKRIAKYYPPPIVITCHTMRVILKEEKLTVYNDHVPLLIKIFTGRSPPQLTHNELKTFSNKFNKIIDIYEKVIKPTNSDGNCRYYPYFLFKMIEDEFKDDPVKLELLDYIHLQSDETIVKHDTIYKKICECAPPEAGLTYRVTDTANRRR